MIHIKTQKLEDDTFFKKMREVQGVAEKIPGLKELKVENILPPYKSCCGANQEATLRTEPRT